MRRFAILVEMEYEQALRAPARLRGRVVTRNAEARIDENGYDKADDGVILGPAFGVAATDPQRHAEMDSPKPRLQRLPAKNPSGESEEFLV